MTTIIEKSTHKFHFIYSILLSICIIVSGICLITSCVSIYHSGDQPFSREAVAAAFADIAIPVYLCLILTIIGFILDIIFTTNIEKSKPTKDYHHVLNILYNKKDFSKCDDKLIASIYNEVHKRKVMNIAKFIVITLCCAVFLIYALNDKNFHQSDITGSMIKAMYVLLPCLIIAFGFTLFSLYYNEKSLQTETELVRQAPVKDASVKTAVTETSKASANEASTSSIVADKGVVIARYVILALGVALLIYGFITGGTADVLTKAVNICTECIGLG